MKYYTPTKLSENIKETPEGYLVCLNVPIARTGIQIYGKGETPIEPGSDGKVKISRSPDEVFKSETIASFEGKSLTIGHPDEFVSPDNWSELSKGIIQNVRRSDAKDEDGEESLLADILVTDADAIAMIKRGLREVSCGYEAFYEETGPGEGKQTTIIGNHLALVDQGRAGPSYAITDHKERSVMKKKWSEKVKELFAKAVDEAEKEEKKSEDAEGKKEDMKDGKEDMPGGGTVSYDELVKMVKDLGEKIASLAPKKEGDEAGVKEDESKDADVSASLEDRLKMVEEKLAKIMEAESAEGEVMSDADPEEMGDEEEEDEESEMTGDTAARVEILAPGLKASAKDAKVKALKTAYATKEGKQVIDSLTGGKPTFDSAEKVETLFVAASEVLKVSRGVGLAATKDSRKVFDSNAFDSTHVITAEKLNEMNQAFWSRK